MTPRQRIHLMAELWPAACRAQGWDKTDRLQRLAVLSTAVGRDLTSANEINAGRDYDRVVAHLNLLAKPDDFNAAMLDAEPADHGERTRLLYGIRRYPEHYVGQIVFSITHGVTRDPEQLTTEQLRKLRGTLTLRARAAKTRRVQEALNA